MSSSIGSSSNIASLLFRTAESAPDRVAVIDGMAAITFGALRDRASAVHERLASMGVRPGERVAMLLERGADAAAAIFGVQAAGAIAVVMNDRLRPRQLEHVLDDAGASVFLTTAELTSRQPRPIQTDARVVDLANVPRAGSAQPVSRVAGDAAQIIYTSGSTGLSKGVVFSHGSLHQAVHTVVAYLGIASDDRIASLLPFSSVYGLNQMLCAVTTASELIIETSPVPNDLVASLRRNRATVVAAVPPLWLQLLGTGSFTQERIESLRIVQNAGGHLPVDAVKRLRQAQPHAQLFLQYGMTETFRSTFLPPEEVDRRPGSMGRAVPGAEILVLREDGTLADVGEVGELVHRGPTIALGYWNNEGATARTFRPNPLRPSGLPDAERVVYSGDMVRRDAEGYLYFVSRADRMIKTLGYRVGPDEIVDVLIASGQVREAVVTTEPDEQRGERIVAHVVLTETGSSVALERFSRTELPRYMQPARFVVHPQLPRLASGKYDLSSLSERATTAAATAGSSRPLTSA